MKAKEEKDFTWEATKNVVRDTGKFFGAAGLLAIVILQGIPFIASVIGCKPFDVVGVVCFSLMIVTYFESYLIDAEKRRLKREYEKQQKG